MNALIDHADSFGWAMMAFGAVLGMLIGLKSHLDNWLGGYGTYRRRILRLGHIASFALGGMTVLYMASVPPELLASPTAVLKVGVTAMVLGALLMPTVCLGTAWREQFRHLFGIPAISVLVALVCMVIMSAGAAK